MFSGAIWAMTLAAWAQKTPPPPPPPSGTVTGHVIFAETQQPARFAEISLIRKPDAAAIAADPAREDSKQEVKTPLSIAAVIGRSGLDGSFTIRDVPPGDFYAIANLAGYVIVIGRIANWKDGRDLDTVMRAIPVVHVAADHSTEIDLTLHRGAVIAGRLQYEDGSPVVEMSVRVDPVEGADELFYLRPSYLAAALERSYTSRYTATSDDKGRYRIVGLPPGKYVVTTELQTSGGDRLNSDGDDVSSGPGIIREIVPIFAPTAFHKADAKIFEIKGAEELDDADIRVELTDLHTVKGAVLAKEDRHAPNQCYLRLSSPDDKQFYRSSRLQSDGTYHFGFVPPGTYTITALAAADLMNPYELDESVSPEYIRRYQQSRVTVIVGEHDVTAEDLVLVEAKPAKEKN
jgi:hypothetical protein